MIDRKGKFKFRGKAMSANQAQFIALKTLITPIKVPQESAVFDYICASSCKCRYAARSLR